MINIAKCTAIKAWLFLVLFSLAGAGWAAQVVGTIVQLSGPLMAKKASGTVRILAMKSEVESGDTLVTEKNTYAMVKFIDNSEITLKPSTTFKVENFSYEAGKPENDVASFSLLKGGLREVTGLLGKRNKEKFAMKTPSATIGIRGTTFIAELVEPTPEAAAAAHKAQLDFLLASTAGPDQAMPILPLPPGAPPPPGAIPLPPSLQGQQPGAPPAGPIQPTSPVPTLAPPVTPTPLPSLRQPGLYVQVLDGLVSLTNSGGAKVFGAGQFGFTPNFSVPPIILPQNPGLNFQPPPVFNSSTAPTAAKGTDKSNAVDCIVR